MTALQESENKYAFEVPEKEKQNRWQLKAMVVL
jgi:hypothetical protein